MIYTLLLTLGGGYYCEFLVGVCNPVLGILSLFQTKKYHFPQVFSDQKGSQIVGETPQFSPVLFSCSLFLNSAIVIREDWL